MYIIILAIVVLVSVVVVVFLTASKKQKDSLQVGDVAPDFELKNFQGQSFRLSSYRGKQSVVVFFYPADNTPGCTAEVSAVIMIVNVISNS